MVLATALTERGCNSAASVQPPARSTGAAADETTPHHGTTQTITTARRTLDVRVIDVHRWQVPHLVLSNVEPDTFLDPGHGADRDGQVFAAPQMPFLEKHVGHMVVARVDDEPFGLPDLAIGGMNAIAAAHRHLTHRTVW